MTNLHTSEEVFKPIIGFPGYEISDYGRVKSYKSVPTGRILANGYERHGYRMTHIRRGDGKSVTKKIHRLVAFHFIGDPPSPKHTDINHKDGNKENNHVSNLEWCTKSQNQLHRYLVLGHSGVNKGQFNAKRMGSKAVVQLSIEGDVIQIFPSASETDRRGFCSRAVGRVCRGQRPHHKGFKWKFFETDV